MTSNVKPKKQIGYYQKKLVRFTSLCDRMSQDEIKMSGRVSEKTRDLYYGIINFKGAIEMAF